MLYIRYTDDPSIPLGAVCAKTGAGIVAQKAKNRRNRKKNTKAVRPSPLPPPPLLAHRVGRQLTQRRKGSIER